MNSTWIAVLLPAGFLLAAGDPAPFVAKVNGKTITAGDVEFMMTTRQIKAEDRAEQQPALVEELVDRQLVREFLARRKIAAPGDELSFQIQRAEDAIRKHGDDPAVLLPRIGYTPERLKSELGLPLAWQVYVRQTVTLPQTQEYFENHRSELDGTRVRARQIFMMLPGKASEAETSAKVSRLKELRARIDAGQISFAEAAKTHSESPSGAEGGDVGIVGARGKLPAPVTRAALELKVNEISEPVVSAFGVHLIQVTERLAGDLSLEDVRPQIVERLSQQLWIDTVARERKTAKIERK